MLMEDREFAAAVTEVFRLYTEIVEYHSANPKDEEGVSTRIGLLLALAMDRFVHDVDGISRDDVSLMLRRTSLSDWNLADMAKDGIEPYHRPLTIGELMRERPGMIPILLARATFCCKFHSMPVMPHYFQETWRRFVQHYFSKL